jgi:hypothetical protein
VVCREEKRAAKERERAEGAGKRHREEVDNDRWRPADDSDDERHGRRQGTFSLDLAVRLGACGVSRGVWRKVWGENAH